MDNLKNDAYYIQKIRQDLEFIVVHMKNVDIEELDSNEILLDSMLFRMIQISENARKLSAEYRAEVDTISASVISCPPRQANMTTEAKILILAS